MGIKIKHRIYVDTSVIGGCFDEEFKEASLLLMSAFKRGFATMVISDITLLELANAPARVKAVVEEIPDSPVEKIDLTRDASALADQYIEARVIGRSNLYDARHIALATVSNANILVSWNFRHMVNLWRIRGYNSVNLRAGYSVLEIRTREEVKHYGEE